MPCCGGKRKAVPISRARYLVGSTLLFGYHGTVGLALEAAAMLTPRFRPVARFHRDFVSDLARSVLRREDIALTSDPYVEELPETCDSCEDPP
jgi:hypothetical protein